MNRLPNLCGILRAKVVLTMNIVDKGQNKGQITDKPLFLQKVKKTINNYVVLVVTTLEKVVKIMFNFLGYKNRESSSFS